MPVTAVNAVDKPTTMLPAVAGTEMEIAVPAVAGANVMVAPAVFMTKPAAGAVNDDLAASAVKVPAAGPELPMTMLSMPDVATKVVNFPVL